MGRIAFARPIGTSVAPRPQWSLCVKPRNAKNVSSKRATKRRGRAKRDAVVPSRSTAFAITLTRAAVFMGGGLALLAAFQIIGLDLSQMVEPGRLKSRLVMFIALMFSIGITATLGAAVGFALLRRGRIIATSRVLSLGAIYGALAYVSFVPTLEALGVVVGGVVFAIAAAATAFIGGLIWSRSPRDLSR